LESAGLCLISLDGGGVRGLSTLYIFQTVQAQANKQMGICLRGPANSGRLIALMLGRLEMDVDECITAYNDLMRKVFGEKLHRVPVNLAGDVNPQFDSATLERAIRGVIASRGISETAWLNDGVQRGCKT
ncbi:phospholipase, patatin family protein, partial [Periconia macrospinosa]